MIIYEKGIIKFVIDFLIDVYVVINDGLVIIFNFVMVVDLNRLGDYDVIFNLIDVGGNKFDLIIVIVIVCDIILLVIIVDIIIIYEKGIMKIVVVFLMDVNVIMNDGLVVIFNFNLNSLK